MNQSIVIVTCAILATCGDRIVVGDEPDSGTDAGVDAGMDDVPDAGVDAGFDAGLPCNGCSTAGTCVAPAANTVTACGLDAGMCVDCSVTVLHAALASCNAGRCDFLACETGWSDCDADRSNGCERNVSACFEVIARNQRSPVGIATDGVDVFWQVADGTIRKVATSGGTVTDLAVAKGGFLLHGPNLYLATDTTLSVMPKSDAGVPTVVTTTASGGFSELVADATSLFWVGLAPDGQASIKSVSLGGGTEALLLGGIQKRIRALTPVDSELWFVVDRDILKLPKAGGVATLLATFPAQPAPTSSWSGDGITLTRDRAYWGVTTKVSPFGPLPAEAAVLAMPYGVPVGTQLAEITFSPMRLVVDGAFIFVAGMHDTTVAGWGAVLRVPIAGGRAEILASGQSPHQWLTADATSIYWVDNDGTFTFDRGEIRKTSK